MDKAFDFVFGGLKPPWNYAAGILTLLILAVPKTMDLLRDLQEERLGRRRLELEKLRLEILKLRVDLRQIEQPQSPRVGGELESVPVPPPPVVKPPRALAERWRPLIQFVVRYPLIGRSVLWIVQIVCLFAMVVFSLDVIGFTMTAWEGKEFEPVESTIFVLLFAGLAGLSYKGAKLAGSIRRAAVASISRGP